MERRRWSPPDDDTFCLIIPADLDVNYLTMVRLDIMLYNNFIIS
jgi:hypothetical protein